MKLWKIKGETHRSAPRSKQIVFNSPFNSKPKMKHATKSHTSKENPNTMLSIVEDKENVKMLCNIGRCSASKILFNDDQIKTKSIPNTTPVHSHSIGNTVTFEKTIGKNQIHPTNMSVNMKKKSTSQNVKCLHSTEFLQFKTKKN